MSNGNRQLTFKVLSGLVLSLFALTSLISGCGSSSTSTPTVTPTNNPSGTQEPTPTATPEPLGSPANPLILGLVKPDSGADISASADELAKQLDALAGYSVKATVFTSYPLLLAGLEEGKVHIVMLPPFTYLRARQLKLAEAALLSNHLGVFQYGTQFMAHVDSGFQSFFDPTQNQSTGDASAALKQFQGKRPCWVEPQSASGYIVPLGLLNQNQIKVPDGVVAQSHNAVVRALYVKGICDFGASFSTYGDPRTSSAVQQDLKDVMDKVLIIWRSEPIIPNLNVSYLPEIPVDMRQNISKAFTDLSDGSDGKSLLGKATDYDIQGFKTADDGAYDALRNLVEQNRIELETLVGK
jgi:phosphonate transport system substrate-binding protein